MHQHFSQPQSDGSFASNSLMSGPSPRPIHHQATHSFHSADASMSGLSSASSSAYSFDSSQGRGNMASGSNDEGSGAGSSSLGRGSSDLRRTSSTGHESGAGYVCPNCGKAFARDDLLRRHLSREARAMAQPSYDRQKSCFECAKSKARCDLEVPSCGRCRSRGKHCVYGARSGNPNVRKQVRDSVAPGHWSDGVPTPGFAPPGWGGQGGFAGGIPGTPGFVKHESSGEEYESDENATGAWHHQQHFGVRQDRALSNASSNDSHAPPPPQHAAFPMAGPTGAPQPQLPTFTTSFQSGFPGARTQSPASFLTGDGSRGGHGSARTTTAGVEPSLTSPLDTRNLGRRGPTFEREEGEETPVGRYQGATFASGPSMTAPIHMGPPMPQAPDQQPTSQAAAASSQDSYPGYPSASHHALYPPQRQSWGPKPQIPKLLTGSRMPVPSNTATGLASARGLFSAQLDLSSWLEDPVVPSPLYRMGPSLASMGLPSALTGAFMPPTPVNEAAAQATRQALLDSGGGGSDDATMKDLGDGKATVAAQIAARHWWANPPDANDVHSQSVVAHACAGHFCLYPALMVLPEPSSPVPPFVHRPWLANNRTDMHESLAVARAVIAAYVVRLPSSEAFVWRQLTGETRRLCDSVQTMERNPHLDNKELGATTAALWQYIVLLMTSSVPGSETAESDGQLIDAALIALSRAARLLAPRVRAMEQAREAATEPSDFLEWGFEETLRRTLFASYALLVLQRFRATTDEVQSQLAGAELVLDLALPAGATIFEASNSFEWKAAQATTITGASNSASSASSTDDASRNTSGAITLRELAQARGAAAKGQPPQHLSAFFDRHDDFTNVVLTVAFAADRLLGPAVSSNDVVA